ncbi:LLM class oxidoreductase [Flindersiella endophytica]
MNDGRLDLGRIGIWTMAFDWQPAARAREAAAQLEELGYRALWVGEAYGRDSVSQSWLLLSATRHLAVASGIANIAVREPVAMAAAERALNEAFPGRYLLGLGGHRTSDTPTYFPGRYGQAVKTMRAYLDAMDAAPLTSVAPPAPPWRLLAALGPKMLELAATRAAGALPYFVSVEHTRRARQALGPDAFLAVEQAVVLNTDLDKAREIARAHVEVYVTAAPYQNASMRRVGFDDADLAGPSDRLVDAIVAYGDLDAVDKRIHRHLDAGADHVCLQVLTTQPADLPMAEWRELAELLKP